jgi:hypothetical protein
VQVNKHELLKETYVKLSFVLGALLDHSGHGSAVAVESAELGSAKVVATRGREQGERASSSWSASR